MAIKKKETNMPVEVPASTERKKVKLLITIVDRGQAIKILNENEKHDVTVQTVLLGYGTASIVLDYLGLGDIKKDVILSLVREDKVPEILSSLEKKFEHMQGIAFTIRLTSMIGASLYKFITKSPIPTKTGGK